MACAAAVGFEGIRDDVSWRRAHEELVLLAKKRAGLDFEEGRWLLRAFRAGVHVELGLGSFNEYVERLFGYGPRFTQEKLRVAEALEGLPETARELESGGVSFSAVRELTRVAIASTERTWLDAAKDRTVREVERLVSGHRPGDRPDVLRFEVSGETLATFREAMAKMAECDGQHLGHVDEASARAHVGASDQPKRAKQSIPPARRRQVLRRDGGCCRVPGCRNATFVDVHHLVRRAEGGSNDIDNLVTLCAAHHLAIHEGRLLSEGTPSTTLVFRHADGSAYGGSLSPALADVRAKAFRALTHMGFSDSEARQALTRVRVGPGLTLELLLRETLRELAPAPP